ncbi:hypothetical protein K458DRAFT_394659 [Lentithecium fluviatile CBS 122367]|uniref:Uncharacterized protein n=1 Tax=Lentithecium fluviatile CBS 122367 TaxID=1168545 RepID=A0A6G1ILC3_9PLEO|nr:hypothetical protein K458DRAFT_394659 [Lentithecium fluviatile CBS 122367]
MLYEKVEQKKQREKEEEEEDKKKEKEEERELPNSILVRRQLIKALLGKLVNLLII